MHCRSPPAPDIVPSKQGAKSTTQPLGKQAKEIRSKRERRAGPGPSRFALLANVAAAAAGRAESVRKEGMEGTAGGALASYEQVEEEEEEAEELDTRLLEEEEEIERLPPAKKAKIGPRGPSRPGSKCFSPTHDVTHTCIVSLFIRILSCTVAQFVLLLLLLLLLCTQAHLCISWRIIGRDIKQRAVSRRPAQWT